MLHDLNSTTDTLGSSDEKPSWVKLDDGEEKRIAFVSTDITMQVVYNLEDSNAAEGTNKYRGSFKSLTAQSVGNRDDICQAIQAGDPDRVLKVDAQTLGEPGFLAAAPIFVYPLQDNGEVDKDVLKAKGFKVQVLLLTPARYYQLKAAIKKKLGPKKLSLLEVDFRLYRVGKEKKWHLEAITDEDSILGKNRKKFQPVVDQRLSAEYSRLGVKDLEGFGAKCVGQNLTESQWTQKLVQFGYMAANTAVSQSVSVGNNNSKGNGSSAPTGSATEEEIFTTDEESDIVFD